MCWGEGVQVGGFFACFAFSAFCITFQAELELPKGNLTVYRKTRNLGKCKCAIYYASCILSGEIFFILNFME